jgi:hypothetical protein
MQNKIENSLEAVDFFLHSLDFRVGHADVFILYNTHSFLKAKFSAN